MDKNPNCIYNTSCTRWQHPVTKNYTGENDCAHPDNGFNGECNISICPLSIEEDE